MENVMLREESELETEPGPMADLKPNLPVDDVRTMGYRFLWTFCLTKRKTFFCANAVACAFTMSSGSWNKMASCWICRTRLYTGIRINGSSSLRSTDTRIVFRM